MRFEIVHNSPENAARIGRLRLRHGDVTTPAFVPVATHGTVKTLTAQEVAGIGYEMILANTYHLHLRPGEALIQELGGLHKFINWTRPILTDSGGYQVMSLAKTRTITDDGVTFQSHLDGSEIHLTPEKSVQIQSALGVDISMALDVCPTYPATRNDVAEAMRRTHLWAPRNLAAKEDEQALFGIVQGGEYDDLRRESAEYISSLGFHGIAIGGVSVGEPREQKRCVVDFTAGRLPKSKPRYLMGVGQPHEIIHAAAAGVDLFDCVLPARMARHHAIFTLQGTVNATNAKWAHHSGPFDEESAFPPLANYSAAYVRHLFKSSDPLAARLATLHNLSFYHRLMLEIREAIRTGQWESLERRYDSYRDA